MLVLTRGVNEAIMIGDSIEITVIDLKGGKVRIGIAAPPSVAVHRKEVYLAIKQANLEAAQGAPQSLEDLQKLVDPKKDKEKGSAP
jgi:carbon storage regulator